MYRHPPAGRLFRLVTDLHFERTTALEAEEAWDGERAMELLAGRIHEGWSPGTTPPRAFAVPKAMGAQEVIHGMVRAWDRVHQHLAKQADPTQASAADWGASLGLAVGEIWLLVTAGRLQGLPEPLVLYGAQVLIDDMREAILRRSVAEASLRLYGERDPIDEGVALAILGIAMLEGAAPASPRTIDACATQVEDAVGAVRPTATDLAELAEPEARRTIADLEGAWTDLWAVGLREFRMGTPRTGRDPFGELDETIVERVKGMKEPLISGSGVLAATGDGGRNDLGSTLVGTSRMLRLLHAMHRDFQERAGTAHLDAGVHDPRGAAGVIARLLHSEPTRRKAEQAMQRYTRALSSWRGNLARARANPRWQPGDPVELPSGLARDELLALLVQEQLLAGKPLGMVLRMLEDAGSSSALLGSTDAAEALRHLALLLASRHLARPAVDQDPIGEILPGMSEDEGAQVKALRQVLSQVEQEVVETLYPTARGAASLIQGIAEDIDRRLDRASGAYPLAEHADRERLGRASDPSNEGHELTYAERVLLRRLGLLELWSLHAYFTVYGQGQRVPIDACLASMEYGERFALRGVGGDGMTPCSTGESLEQFTDRIVAACQLATRREAPTGGGMGPGPGR